MAMTETLTDQALCRDEPDLWFVPPGKEFLPQRQRAIETCYRCPLQEPCLVTAVETNELYGIWGGKTEKERANIRKNRVRRLRQFV